MSKPIDGAFYWVRHAYSTPEDMWEVARYDAQWARSWPDEDQPDAPGGRGWLLTGNELPTSVSIVGPILPPPNIPPSHQYLRPIGPPKLVQDWS